MNLRFLFPLALLFLLSSPLWGQTTWVNVSPPASAYHHDMHWVDDMRGYIVASDGNTHLCFRTVDQGNSWTSANLGAEMTRVYFLDSLTGFAAGASGQSTKTTDGGLTWTSPVAIDNFSNPIAIGELQFTDPLVGYLTVVEGLQSQGYKTVDGGNSWSKVEIPMAVNFFLTASGVQTRKSFWFQDAMKGFAGRRRGWLHTTTNGAASWDSIPVDTNFVPVVFDFVDANKGYVCGPLYTYVTTDGGSTWNQRPGLSRCSEANEFVCPNGKELHVTSQQLGISTWESRMEVSLDDGMSFQGSTPPSAASGLTGSLACDDLDFPSPDVGFAIAINPDFSIQSSSIWRSLSGGVGIADGQGLAQELTLFPNPTNGKFWVQAGTPDLIAVSVLDLQGKVLVQSTMDDFVQKVELNTSTLPAGMYLVRATLRDGSQQSMRFRLQH